MIQTISQSVKRADTLHREFNDEETLSTQPAYLKQNLGSCSGKDNTNDLPTNQLSPPVSSSGTEPFVIPVVSRPLPLPRKADSEI